ALTDLLDDAAPLVARDARVAHPAQVELALEHLHVGAAQTGKPAADEDVARPANGCLDLSVDHLVRALYHDRLHGGKVYAGRWRLTLGFGGASLGRLLSLESASIDLRRLGPREGGRDR